MMAEALPGRVEVEIHRGATRPPAEADDGLVYAPGEDKFHAVKVARCNKDLVATGTVGLFAKCPAPLAGRRTIEIASFDNVFGPYIKPPT
jgi:hypothetical protein